MMEYKKRYIIHTLSNNSGWVLVYALVFILVIQASVMIMLSLVRYNTKSSNAFYDLLCRLHSSAEKETPPQYTSRVLDAPEGWDHKCFNTEVLEKCWGNERSFSWRVQLREQPYSTTHDPLLSFFRAYIIILIDDSESMKCSSGKDYGTNQLYFENSAGEIVPTSYRSDVQDYLNTPEGTYFSGAYGNTHFTAPDTNSWGGTMPCWTLIQSHIIDLLDELDMCDIAIASVSHGLIQPFTRDKEVLSSALDNLHPHSIESHLSESLAHTLESFPKECITAGHIILATNGIAINDGNIPGWLQDFDADSNVMDCHVQETGSHCLDDVAAYASSMKFPVHVIGPDTTFLRNVSQKGTGAFMPEKQDLVSEFAFVCQMRAMYAAVKRNLINIDVTFSPPWLGSDSAAWYLIPANNALEIAAVPTYSPMGLATTMYTYDNSLMCSTSHDYFLCIDMITGNINWVIRGIGGTISVRDEYLVAGPNSKGDIYVFGRAPEIFWVKRGEHFEASQGNLYIAHQKKISSFTSPTGMYTSEFDAGNTISVLSYDPCRGLLLAGTQTGMIYVLDQDLEFQALLITNLAGKILNIRTFSWLKKLHIIALTETHATCMTSSEILWSSALEHGSPTNSLVMDYKVYITTWNGDDVCGGIDTGTSTLLILDAITGETLSEGPLFKCKAFGPLIDLNKGILEHTAWDMNIHEEDISPLEGLNYCQLGKKIEQACP